MLPIRRVPDIDFGTVKERVGIQSTPESRAMSPDIDESIINQNQPLTPPPRNPRGGEPIRPTTDFSAPQSEAPDVRNPFPPAEEFYYDPFRGYTKLSEKNRYDVPDESIDFAPPSIPDPDISAQNRYKNDGTLKEQEDHLNHQRNTYSPITGMVTMKNGGRVQSSTKKSGEREQSYTNKSGGINLGSGRVSTASKNSKTPKW